MKAILEFNLDEPDDKYLFEIHNKAVNLHMDHEEFSSYLMRIDKYKDFTEEQDSVIEEIRDKFREIFSDV